VEELLPQFHHDRSNTKDSSSHSVVRDMNKCVLCTRCIRACSQVQGMVRVLRRVTLVNSDQLHHPLTASSPHYCVQHILGMIGRGAEEEVSTINSLPLNQTGARRDGNCN
jgi:NADH dehydrogenase/NADH:ubiquinone oxidoreductase subunit G